MDADGVGAGQKLPLPFLEMTFQHLWVSRYHLEVQLHLEDQS